MSDSPNAEEDMERFESRVIYRPIERFRGKTLVLNQCCSMYRIVSKEVGCGARSNHGQVRAH